MSSNLYTENIESNDANEEDNYVEEYQNETQEYEDEYEDEEDDEDDEDQDEYAKRLDYDCNEQSNTSNNYVNFSNKDYNEEQDSFTAASHAMYQMRFKRKKKFSASHQNLPQASHKKSPNDQLTNRKSSPVNFEMYRNMESIQVNCNSFIGELFKKKFGSGGKGSCIRTLVEAKNENGESSGKKEVEKWMTPIEFEQYCGKGNCRDWKRTIKVGGQSLVTLLENNILVCHAVSCSCAACNKNESLVGPIRPFMRYRRRKKDEILAQNAFKKFLSLKPPTILQESLQKIQNNKSNSPESLQNTINLSSMRNMTFFDSHKPNQTASSPLSSVNDSSDHPTTFSNNKQIIKDSLENQKDFAACLEEFEEIEEKKWSAIEQECHKLSMQAQTLQTLIQQTRKQSELNRQILIKKFFNNN